MLCIHQVSEQRDTLLCFAMQSWTASICFLGSDCRNLIEMIALQESELTPTGSNLLDGRLALFQTIQSCCKSCKWLMVLDRQASLLKHAVHFYVRGT